MVIEGLIINTTSKHTRYSSIENIEAQVIRFEDNRVSPKQLSVHLHTVKHRENERIKEELHGSELNNNYGKVLLS